jgi:hypothetical protein
MSRWSTIASYGTVAQALAAERRLQDAKIRARVLVESVTEETVGLYWTPRNVTGGHRVQVSPDDEVSAARLLGISLDAIAPIEAAPTADPDADAARALRAAVLGVFICMGIAHVYSLYLALQLREYKLSPKGRRDRTIALTIDLIVLASIGVLFFSILAH